MHEKLLLVIGKWTIYHGPARDLIPTKIGAARLIVRSTTIIHCGEKPFLLSIIYLCMQL